MSTTVTASSETDLQWFRLVVALALVASIWITWPLWNVRNHPALLPALELPQFSLGAPLIVATIAALAAPLRGTILVSALIAYGMATDQTRMQPEFFSLPILLWGSLPISSARLVARAHLLALWFYAGAHKLISLDYLNDAAFNLSSSVPLDFASSVAVPGAIAIALAEMGTSVLAMWPATRRIAAWSALFVHAGILVALGTLGEERNVAIWPWNIVLACSGFALIAPWTTSILASFQAASIVPRLIAAAIAITPTGFYAGTVDAYPAHHLYSSGTARATVYCPAGCRLEQDVNATWHELNVPLPPEPRLFFASFAKTCAPGDVLRIDIPRSPPWNASSRSSVSYCPFGSLPASHP